MGSASGKRLRHPSKENDPTQTSNCQQLKEGLIKGDTKVQTKKSSTEFGHYQSPSILDVETNIRKYEDQSDASLQNNQLNLAFTNEKSIPKIPCALHKERNIELINVNSTASQRLYCYECAFSKNSSEKFINLKDIFQCSQKDFSQQVYQIQESNDQAIYKAIVNSNISKNVFLYFEQSLQKFRIFINQYLDDQFKKLQENQRKFEGIRNVSFDYTQYQEHLSQCFHENKDDLSKLDKELSKLIQKQSQNRESLSKELSSCSEILKDCINTLYDLPDNIKDHVKQYDSFTKEFPDIFQNNMEDISTLVSQPLKLSTENVVQTGEFYQNISKEGLEICNYHSYPQQFYINQNLLQNSFYKYEVTFEYEKKSPNSKIHIGLEHNQNNNNQFNFINQNISFSCSQYSENSKIEVKLQIYLKDKLFRTKIGDKIQQLDWKNYSQTSQSIYLKFLMCENSKVIIKSFKKVLIFEKW